MRGPDDGSPHSASTIQPEGDAADSAPEAAPAVCGDSEEVDTIVEEELDAKVTKKKARAAKPAARKRGTSRKRKVAEDARAGPEEGQAGEQTPAALDTATPAAGGKGSVRAAEGSARPTTKRRGRPAERSSEGARRIPGRLQPWACTRCTLENPVCTRNISAALLETTPVSFLSVPVLSEAVLWCASLHQIRCVGARRARHTSVEFATRPDRLMLSKRCVVTDQGQRQPVSLLSTQSTTRAFLSSPREAAPPRGAAQWRRRLRHGSVAERRRRS